VLWPSPFAKLPRAPKNAFPAFPLARCLPVFELANPQSFALLAIRAVLRRGGLARLCRADRPRAQAAQARLRILAALGAGAGRRFMHRCGGARLI